MSDAASDLRALMRSAPQPVTVVTARGPDGPRGITVSSFISVSLAPPSVLISIMKSSQAHAAIAGGRFRVHLLAADQAPVSGHFARPGLSSEEQFAGRYRQAVVAGGEGGPPRLPGCLGAVECESVAAYDGGDHTLFVGGVREVSLERSGEEPLLYFSRGYRRIGAPIE